MGILPKCFCFSDSKHTNSSPDANKYSSQIEELCHRLSLQKLRESTNNFDKSRILGRVGFGYVYKGCICIQGVSKHFAVKRFASSSDHGFSQFVNESELFCQLCHPNLASLIGSCNYKDDNILVYEYMPNRSLAEHLLDNAWPPLSWKRRLEICIGAAYGLYYLHTGVKRTILHRQVKADNIFLDQNLIPKLADFGLCMKVPLSISKPKPLIERVVPAETFGYLAPECFISSTLTEKCDVFSFGMVLLVMVCANDPLSISRKIDQQKNQIVEEGGGENENKHLQGSSYKNLASKVYNLVHEGMADEIVDPFLMGKIAPKCWRMFMDIAEGRLLFEPNERPAMGEVEVELEHALALQEEADKTNPSDVYGLLSTVIASQPENANQN